MGKKKIDYSDPIAITQLKRTKFHKSMYRFFDAILPNNYWPIIGKIANRIRISIFRKISPNVSKKITLNKGCEIYPCVTIEDNVLIGINCHLNWLVTIKSGAMIAKDVYFNTQNHVRNEYGEFEGLSDIQPIVVGKNCWIGTKSIILRGVEIGDYSNIGGGSVVTKSVPAHCLAAGNPAVVKKVYPEPKQRGEDDEQKVDNN